MNRKVIALILTLTSAFFISNASNYEVITDSAIKPKTSINFELVQGEINSKNRANLVLKWGTFGYIEPVENVGLDFAYRMDWLNTLNYFMGEEITSPQTEYELGAHYIYKTKHRVFKDRVILSNLIVDQFRRGNTEYTVREIKYLTLDIDHKYTRGFRGGFIGKTSKYYYKVEDVPLGVEGSVQPYLTSSGLYLGFLIQQYRNAILKVEDYGIRSTSDGADWFFDLLVIPFNKFEAPDAHPYVQNYLDNEYKSSPVGFRVGFSYYQVERKLKTRKFGGKSHRIEGGWKPSQGWYAMMSYSTTLFMWK